ncbi:EAL domain-containing protein (putative c-di-GMP-specific phosphodiesterase class I) [Paraburkholderia bannensis]|uniref:EAL domain-containing protein (Putative c-di-GMP-specific phosphodiesterase class I) n=1 Tax=Paraburkholderia bannensis TaxID=765414 RepID=A0A7W9TWJ2_9BURK|nr:MULTISPECIES: EAL domain-containing protein [Paraburkholderia]MBB3257175.1 EAL domain-containing protein (putative c-di-GMP-specific phosphodiesterase class I) [Paraburkholderia sp. WP4_3_2]MBB6102429.1 EAL domain-containing protein (putative c-di-GMP-specific phosphodiesterase class I) [Paraburkholderia bannensis]
MAFAFPVSTFRGGAFNTLRRASETGLAVVLVICTCTSLAFAGPADTSSGSIPTIERNVWQQLTDWLAGPPAAPIRIGSDCASIAELPVVPAALAGPVAGPMPVRTNTCDSLNDMRDVAIGTAAAKAASGPNAVTLLREVRWHIGDQEAAERNAPPASDAMAGVSSRADWAEQSPEQPAISAPDCSAGSSCETQAISPSIGADTLAPARALAAIATQRTSARNILGFVVWPIVVAVLVVVAGWALKRWFRYDRSLLRAARAGLRRGEFHLEYQPVVSVRRARCVGVEALLRWDNQKYGALGPAHYMEFIEDSSLIGPMTRFVVSRAAQELREIGAPKSLYLGVTAPASYLISSGFNAHLADVGSLGVPPLILKIGAGSARKFKKRLIPLMAQAREKGVRFALSAVRPTDVGLELSKEMSFEMVKIDRNVLANDPDERSRQVSALTRMGHEIGAVVVVEGIENAAHHHIARTSRAEFGQGFFYSRALSASRLKEFIETVNAPSSERPGAATMLTWRVRNF